MVRALRQILNPPSFAAARKAAEKPIAKVPAPKTASNIFTAPRPDLGEVVASFITKKAEAAAATEEAGKAEAKIVEAADTIRRQMTRESGELVTSVNVRVAEEIEVQVTWRNTYGKIDEAAAKKLRDILGDEFGTYFTRIETVSFRTPTDLDLISEVFALVSEQVPERVASMTPEQRFAEYFFVAVSYEPTMAYHQQRFLDLPAEKLEQIEKIVSQSKPGCK